MSQPITLDTWYEHMEHLQCDIKHSKFCGICMMKTTPRREFSNDVKADVKFHNREKSKVAASGQ